MEVFFCNIKLQNKNRKWKVYRVFLVFSVYMLEDILRELLCIDFTLVSSWEAVDFYSAMGMPIGLKH